jgi:hypothetical protein
MSHRTAPFVTETGSTGQAPSNMWDPFFGTPEGYHEEVRADDQLQHETYNLPKAYEGRNRRLEDVLDFMIREEDEFYTRDLLPWEFTEDLSITWDVWRFNRTLADVVPEQGISRLVTQESERHTDNLVRRGLAFQLEHGFMTTDKGRRNYALNLQQISDAVHTTCYFGVMHALFAGQNYYKEYRRKFARHVKGPRTLFRHERQMWACLQKDIKGVFIMDAEIKHHMKINGVTPDVLVLPPKAGIYVSMVPPSETTYSQRGPGAHEALTDDRTGITTFRGTKVFETQSFDVDFQHEFIDLTSRPRMCGEYFVIPGTDEPLELGSHLSSALNAWRGTNKIQTGLDSKEFMKAILEHKSEPFIHIYSADKDDYVKITFAEANVKALNGKSDLQAANEKLEEHKKTFHDQLTKFEEIVKKIIGNKTKPKDKKDIAQAAAFDDDSWNVVTPGNTAASQGSAGTAAQTGNTVNDVLNDIEKILTTAPNNSVTFTTRQKTGTLPITRISDTSGVNAIEARAKELKTIGAAIHNLDLYFNAARDNHRHDILLFRPFQTYTMHSAIMAQGGSDLGSVFHGHHDFQLSDNVATKTHFGNYTFYSKAVVKQPKNYTIIQDCFAQGYISGEGHTFFEPNYKDTGGGVADHSLQAAIQEGTLGSSECRRSLIAWRIPKGEGEKLADALDITGRFAAPYRDYEAGSQEHFPGAFVLSSLERIDELDQNRLDDEYLHQVQHINTICFRGAQYTNGIFTNTGRGHWGTPYAGVLPVRDGAMMYMDPDREPKKGDRIV